MSNTRLAGVKTVWRPEAMLNTAVDMLGTGDVDGPRLLEVAAAHIKRWGKLAEQVEAGAQLDGRASIYTGETYADARDRWATYRGLLLDHLRGPDGGGT